MTVLMRAKKIMDIRFQVIDLQCRMEQCSIVYDKWLELYNRYLSMYNSDDSELKSIGESLGSSLINARVLVNNNCDEIVLNNYKTQISDNFAASKKVLISKR